MPSSAILSFYCCVSVAIEYMHMGSTSIHLAGRKGNEFGFL